MEKKLQEFLDKAFAPYGEFPARDDVIQELLANLQEKFRDLKAQGKSDDEAYQATVDSFGDVAEIMEQVSHEEPKHGHEEKADPRLYQTIIEGIKEVTGSKSAAKASVLKQADLTDTDLAGTDFSMSELTGASFDRSNLARATFKATALRGASFAGANLS